MPAWVEMHFRTFTATFRRVRLYTGGLTEDLSLFVWHGGQWEEIGGTWLHIRRDPVISLELGEPVATPRLRIVMKSLNPLGRWRGGWGQGGAPELYEVELYE